MDMNNMGHSGMDMSSMSMGMTFSNTHNTPLYSTLWTPSCDGAYAGTCIFLIILAIINRGLFAVRAIMERRWHAAHMNRRYIIVAGKTPEAERIDADPNTKFAALVTAQGVEQNVKVVEGAATGALPWRFSTDVPRALIFLCITGTIYLLYVLDWTGFIQLLY